MPSSKIQRDADLARGALAGDPAGLVHLSRRKRCVTTVSGSSSSWLFDRNVAPATPRAAAPPRLPESRVIVVDLERNVAGGYEFGGHTIRVVVRMLDGG